MNPVGSYETINLEALSKPTLSRFGTAMRSMIDLGKPFRVFGPGTIKFLNPATHY